MPAYDVSASVTSPPTNVGLKIDGVKLFFARDKDGNWAASRQEMQLAGDIPIEFRAVGFSGSDWKLTITFTQNPAPVPPKDPVKYSHEDKIPDDLLSIVNDTVKL